MQLRLSAFIVVLATSGPAMATDYDDPKEVLSLTGLWLFNEGDNPAFALETYDDLAWKERTIPTRHAPFSERWVDSGWYRLHLHLTSSTAKRNLRLSLGPAREAIEIYVNGSLIGSRGRFGTRKRAGARVLPLAATVPHGLLHPGNNVIAVRIYDPSWTGGLVGGPIVIGPPAEVDSIVSRHRFFITSARVGLGLLALFVGLLHLLFHLGRRSGEGGWWGIASGTSLFVVNLSGVGLFSSVLGADFSARLQDVASMVAILCLGSLFADLYEDIGRRRVVIAQGVIVFLIWVVALLPSLAAYFVAPPIILLSALVSILYVANLCSQALRRGEPGTLPIFVAISGLAVLIVYDGFVANRADTLPPAAMIGAVAALALTAGVQIRQLVVEHGTTLQRWVRLSQRVDGMPYRGVIEATAMPMDDAEAFLTTAIHEVARDLEVRRCSLVLRHNDGTLRMRASVGLPKHVVHGEVQSDSIAGWAFRHDEVVTNESLPDELLLAKRGAQMTDAFIAQPVRQAGRVIGVLNLSDRNDGGDFTAADAAAASELATKLALSIVLLPPQAFDPPPEVEVAARKLIRPSNEPKATSLDFPATLPSPGARPMTVPMSEEQAAQATAAPQIARPSPITEPASNFDAPNESDVEAAGDDPDAIPEDAPQDEPQEAREEALSAAASLVDGEGAEAWSMGEEELDPFESAPGLRLDPDVSAQLPDETGAEEPE